MFNSPMEYCVHCRQYIAPRREPAGMRGTAPLCGRRLSAEKVLYEWDDKARASRRSRYRDDNEKVMTRAAAGRLVARGKELTATARAEVKETADVAGDNLILDIGPRSASVRKPHLVYSTGGGPSSNFWKATSSRPIEILEHRASTMTL